MRSHRIFASDDLLVYSPQIAACRKETMCCAQIANNKPLQRSTEFRMVCSTNDLQDADDVYRALAVTFDMFRV